VDTDEKKAELFRKGLNIQLQDHLSVTGLVIIQHHPHTHLEG
jgi:hypothetical protein